MSAVLEAQEASARDLEAVQPALVRQFDLLATAPGGVARLRELILTLAVQGKLVAQDARDEPAHVLLDRIGNEKGRQIVNSVLKREKALPAISEDELPFELPMTWVWVRLGTVTNYGSPAKATTIKPDTWVLDLEDIEKSSGRLLHRIRFADRPALSDKNSFLKGDVLYGKLRPYLNKVIVADEPGVCTTELMPLRCYGESVPEFFRIVLSSPHFLDYVNARSYGMKMPRLGTDDARRALVPLPPLTEQARIVARVEELMRLCDALEAKGRLEAAQHAQLLSTLLGTLPDSASPEELATNWQRVAAHFDLLLDSPEAVNALEQTILQLAVRGLLVPQDAREEPAGDLLNRIGIEKDRLTAGKRVRQKQSGDEGVFLDVPFQLPSGWVWVRFGDLAIISSGVTLGRKTAMAKPVSLPYLRVANVQRWRLELSVMKDVLIDESELSRFQVRAGDLLITEGGDWDKVGRTAIWREEIPICLHQNHIFKARGVTEDWNASWAELFLNSTAARSYFATSAKQTTNLASINMTELKCCLFPLPPPSEQARIVARVVELRLLCGELRRRLITVRSRHSLLAEQLTADAVA